MRILYPMFVHCHLSLVKLDAGATARDFHRRFAPDHELLHGEDVAKLRGLASPEHVASDATARAFLENKLPVRCCEYTFDLLIKYLHLANQMALLAILNARVAVTVVPGDPSPREDEVDVSARSAITGAGPVSASGSTCSLVWPAARGPARTAESHCSCWPGRRRRSTA